MDTVVATSPRIWHYRLVSLVSVYCGRVRHKASVATSFSCVVRVICLRSTALISPYLQLAGVKQQQTIHHTCLWGSENAKTALLLKWAYVSSNSATLKINQLFTSLMGKSFILNWQNFITFARNDYHSHWILSFGWKKIESVFRYLYGPRICLPSYLLPNVN